MLPLWKGCRGHQPFSFTLRSNRSTVEIVLRYERDHMAYPKDTGELLSGWKNMGETVKQKV